LKEKQPIGDYALVSDITTHDGSSNAHIDIREAINKVLPVVSEVNNGEFLRVVNGAWHSSIVNSAEEALF
jgi:hypothetical protein